jgi:serine/threonine protein kinase
MKECPVCKRCFADEINHCPQDGDATSPSLLGEPTLDGRYLLERRLGQGGMGVVFQARHIFLKTAHAIKIILPDLVGNDPMLATRFRQEALAAAAIRHQNIIAVTDFGVVRGTMPFLVMEFIKGRSLQEILGAEGPMKPERAWELISPVASGVGAAHRHDIVHRDLKPLNIMVQDDMPINEGVKILDFGLAKIKSGELLGSFIQAQTSGLMGSPFYMAPEQWSDEEPDARADIYSLGVILYQMLAGEVPFKGSSIPSIMKKHLTLPPPSFQSMGISVPPALEAVVRHSLEKEVADRIDSIESFLMELRAAMSSTPIIVTTSRPTGSLDPNKTMASEISPPPITHAQDLSSTAVQPPQINETQFSSSFDSMAGTVSSSALGEELQKQLTDTAAAHRREKEEQETREKQEQLVREREQQEARERQEQLAREKEEQEARERQEQQSRERQEQDARERQEQQVREAEARFKAEQEADLRRQEEEERYRREQEERAAKEREQQEKLERMAQQAQALEDRLERLAISIPPSPGATDAAQSQQAVNSFPGQSSFPGQTSYPDQSLQTSYPGHSIGQAPTIVTEVSEPKRNNSVLLIIAGLVIFGLGGGGAAAYFIFRPKPKPPIVNKPPVETLPVVKAELVQIDGGNFQMGRNAGTPQERPAHPIQVQSFFMDKTEVTNAEYAAFVRETNHPAPGYWSGNKPPFGQELWPVVSVSQEDANQFAAWRSKRDGAAYRLPTEEEWEFAARNGEQSDLYPWGKDWQESNVVVKEATPAPVGSRPAGRNKWGVADLIGNVWEWTSSKVSVYPGNPATIPTETRDLITIRGACYVSDPTKVDSPITSAMREFIPANTKTPLLGFRLVRSGS